MHVRVLVLVVIRDPVDHRLWTLGRGRIVEPDELLAVDHLGQDREVGSHRFHGAPTDIGGRCSRGSAGRVQHAGRGRLGRMLTHPGQARVVDLRCHRVGAGRR
ncbi:hypothetical protein SDC9_212336 [bioreactor metagenome]|uniref:Uncharacterized protein n=1 Tax=bioreactor metagenome TaxID=1076179 RepID=A0A645JLT4_9ZZZZ